MRSSCWEEINWRHITSSVKKLKCLIFKAKKNSNAKLVRKLQILLLASKANILLSIFWVLVYTRTNRIKTNYSRWALFEELSLYSQREWFKFLTKPLQRKYRSTFDEILCIETQVIQYAVKNALEPEWEAIFESTSSCCKTRKLCHYALQENFASTVKNNKKCLWALNINLKGCFHTIDPNILLDLLSNFPALNVIKAWLKAGYHKMKVLDFSSLSHRNILFPLLFNIYLHGIENYIKTKIVLNTNRGKTYSYLRFSDDFIFLVATREKAEFAKKSFAGFFEKRGIEISFAKFQVVHLRVGFNFLGCQIRLCGLKPYRFLIIPHPDKISTFKKRLKNVWLQLKANEPELVITKLNFLVWNWANYYKFYISSKVFLSLDYFMWQRAWRYVRRRHPQKNHSWIVKHYFKIQIGSFTSKWRFFVQKGEKRYFLLRFRDFNIT